MVKGGKGVRGVMRGRAWAWRGELMFIRCLYACLLSPLLALALPPFGNLSLGPGDRFRSVLLRVPGIGHSLMAWTYWWIGASVSPHAGTPQHALPDSCLSVSGPTLQLNLDTIISS